MKKAVPVALGIVVLGLWEGVVRYFELPPFVLPGPLAIASVFWVDTPLLLTSAWTTVWITFVAFAVALLGGIGVAVLLSQSRIVESALYPYAVILQVTPVIAIAPLIQIWVGLDRINVALVIIAWIIAFFPILAGATMGLKSADHNLIDLFRLHGATRWQILTRLQFPTALPSLLGAMKVSGGLSLVGAVAAELVAGSGASNGLGWRILDFSHRLQIARMFAALTLLAVLGIAIFALLSLLEWALLHRWHESALEKQQ